MLVATFIPSVTPQTTCRIQRSVMPGDPLPFTRLRYQNKVQHVIWDETEGPVVILVATL